MKFCIGRFVAFLQLSDQVKTNKESFKIFLERQFFLLAYEQGTNMKQIIEDPLTRFNPTAWSQENDAARIISEMKQKINKNYEIKQEQLNTYYGVLVHQNSSIWYPLLQEGLIKMNAKVVQISDGSIQDKLPIQVEVYLTRRIFCQSFIYQQISKQKIGQDINSLINPIMALNCVFQLLLIKSESISQNTINLNSRSLCFAYFMNNEDPPMKLLNDKNGFYLIARDIKYYLSYLNSPRSEKNIMWKNSIEDYRFIIFEKLNGKFINLQQLLLKFSKERLCEASESQFQVMIDSIDIDMQFNESETQFQQPYILREVERRRIEVESLIKLTLTESNFQKQMFHGRDILQQIQRLTQLKLPVFAQNQIMEQKWEKLFDNISDYLEQFEKLNMYSSIVNIHQLKQNIFDFLPEHKQSVNFKSKLSAYQSKALSFMLFREGKLGSEYVQQQTDIMNQFSYYQKYTFPYGGQNIVVNTLTGQIYQTSPPQVNVLGGILGGMPGAGKTVTTLALISESVLGKQNKPVFNNLVIVNKKDCNCWIDQIKNHFQPNRVNYQMCRDICLEKDQNVDIALLTYEELISAYNSTETIDSSSSEGEYRDDEYIPKKRPCKRQSNKKINQLDSKKKLIFKEWNRIILDEPQMFSTEEQFINILKQLNTKIKWCLSSQPYQNKIESFKLMINFLQLQPLNQEFWFQLNLRNHLSQKKILLNQFLKPYFYSLASECPIPERHLLKYTLNDQEKKIYSIANQKNGAKFDLPDDIPNVMNQNRYLGQICNHPYMLYKRFGSCEEISKKNIELFLKDHLNNDKQSSNFLNEQINTLKETDQLIFCNLCYQDKNDFAVASCGHSACSTCFGKIQIGLNFRCPFCKLISGRDNIFVYTGRQNDIVQPSKLSSKLKILIDQIYLISQKHPNEKVIIANRYRTMIEIIKRHLDERQFPNLVVEYRKKKKEFNKTLTKFKNHAGFIILQTLITSQNENQSYLEASHIFIVDSWWTIIPEYELLSYICSQIQKKQIHIYNFEGENTIEEYMNELQKEQYDSLIYK